MGILYRYAIIAAITASILGACIYTGVSWERDRRAADDARARLETIDTVEDLENEAENTSDDDLADSISDVQ